MTPADTPCGGAGPRVSGDLQKLYEWIREPDWSERFGTQETVDWINRRPCGSPLRAKAELEAAVARADAAEGALRKVTEALCPTPEADAGYNLEGALDDLNRLGADQVCRDTIRRVVGQIAQAKAALTPPAKTAVEQGR